MFGGCAQHGVDGAGFDDVVDAGIGTHHVLDGGASLGAGQLLRGPDVFERVHDGLCGKVDGRIRGEHAQSPPVGGGVVGGPTQRSRGRSAAVHGHEDDGLRVVRVGVHRGARSVGGCERRSSR